MKTILPVYYDAFVKIFSVRAKAFHKIVHKDIYMAFML